MYFFWNIFLASLLPTKKHVIETCQQQVGMPSPGLQLLWHGFENPTLKVHLKQIVATLRGNMESVALCLRNLGCSEITLFFWGVRPLPKTDDRQVRWHVWGNKTCFFWGKMDGFGWFMSMVLRQLLCIYIDTCFIYYMCSSFHWAGNWNQCT